MRLRKPRTLLATLGIAGAVVAGCGGSQSQNQSLRTADSHARRTPLASSADVRGTTHHAAALGQLPAGRSRSTVKANRSDVTTAKVAKARQTAAASKDDESMTSAKVLNPCKLVSLAEAKAITRGAVRKATEAPLGPTCIYSGTGHRGAITLTLETQSFGGITRHMHARKQVVIRGRRSLCGRLGTQMLFVPLARYQLLNVTAPCEIARRFAALAVSRLSA